MNTTRPLLTTGGLMPGGLAAGQAGAVATGLERAALPGARLAATFRQPRPLSVPGRLRRAAVLVGDLIGAVAIVLCLPFVILAIGTPIVLCVRLLLWVGGLL